METEIPKKQNTFKEELLERYHKIPYSTDVDSRDLNNEFADMLVMNEELRRLMEIRNKMWEFEDFDKMFGILASNQWADWEIEEVFNAYSPENWSKLENKKQIQNKWAGDPDVLRDPFDIGIDLYPFRVDKYGVYGRKKVDDEFEEYQITKTPIVITNVCESLDGESSYKCKVKYKSMSRKTHEKYVEPSLLLSCDVKTLGDMGLVVIDEDTKKMKQYFKKLLDIDNQLPVEYTAWKCGWYQDNSVLVTGRYKHTAYGMDEIVQLSDFLQDGYDVKGSKERWIKTTARAIESPLERIKMYGTVGSFIIRFTGINTFVMHNFYESSGGKSTSMKIAASLVGNPTYDGLVEDARSTAVGIEKHLEYNSDTPVYFDETSNNKEFKDYIYMMGNGKGKGRGTKDTGQRGGVGYSKGGTWHTIIQSTGEFSLVKGDNVSTGMKMRVIELHERLPEYEQEYLEELNNVVDENYGLFLEEIIQKIIKIKDKIGTLYNTYSKCFEKPGSNFSERVKTYFVVLAIAGYVLEDVFRNNGIPIKNPVDICNEYYKKIVLDDPTSPYSDRALHSTYQWTVRNLAKFERSCRDFGSDGLSKGAIEVQGWITNDCIYYDETMLKKALEDMGYDYERAKEDWKKAGIIEPYMKKGIIQSYRCQSKINGKAITGIKIKISTLKDKLNMDEKILEVRDDKDDDTQSLKEKCVDFLKENPLYNNATCSDEKAAIAFIQSNDQIELLHGKEYIINTMSLCKKGCRSS